jgi:alkylhydroperoxidase/carboxymuconolactone decarboxylase family protein YurZ
MDEKIELLICLGAATAANCVPCFEHYFSKARVAGVEVEQVLKAVELANKVKTGSSIVMRNSITDIMGCAGESDRRADGTGEHTCCNRPG